MFLTNIFFFIGQICLIFLLDDGITTFHHVSLVNIQKYIRPLQFNYLSYKLFLEKKSCQTPKKKKKSHLWCLTDESGFENFCQTPKEKKKCKFQEYSL